MIHDLRNHDLFLIYTGKIIFLRVKKLDGFVLSKHMYAAAVYRSNTFIFSPPPTELPLASLTLKFSRLPTESTFVKSAHTIGCFRSSIFALKHHLEHRLSNFHLYFHSSSHTPFRVNRLEHVTERSNCLQT